MEYESFDKDGIHFTVTDGWVKAERGDDFVEISCTDEDSMEEIIELAELNLQRGGTHE